MNYSRHITAISLLLLCACSGGTVKDTLGLSRAAPDEFRVVSRPPLSVPPQFSLQPPSATTTAPGQLTPEEQAKSLVLGTDPGALRTDTSVAPVTVSKAGKLPAKTSAESTFLKNAGADQADPNVRNELVEEKFVKQQEDEDASWWDVTSKLPDKKEPIVKAKDEAERIQKNEDEGKPVTEGETPETMGRDTGVLGRIFGY